MASESLPTLAALKLHKWLEIARHVEAKGVAKGKGAKSLNCLRPTDRTRQTTRAELTDDNATRAIQNLNKYSHAPTHPHTLPRTHREREGRRDDEHVYKSRLAGLTDPTTRQEAEQYCRITLLNPDRLSASL